MQVSGQVKFYYPVSPIKIQAYVFMQTAVGYREGRTPLSSS